jgi:hypothetical protein
LYIEPLSIGTLKISQIWKAIIIGIFFFTIVGKKIPAYVWIGILFSLKYLVYMGMPYGYMGALKEAFENLIFPLFMGYLYINYKNKSDAIAQLMSMIILFSLFFIYSTVPFFLGVESLNPITDLAKYGLDYNATKGLFYHIADASKIFAISTIVLILSYKYFSNNFLNKMIWIVGVLLGLYFIYSSWSRTAWAIFLIVLTMGVFYGVGVKRALVAIATLMVLSAVLFELYKSSEALQLRLAGGAIYRTNVELSFEQLALSRVPFVIVAVDNLANEEGLAQLFGYGQQHGIDLFEQKTGMSIISHNRTMEILESSGAIGLFLYTIFIIMIVRVARKNWQYVSSSSRRLGFSSFLLFTGFYLTSHGIPLWGEIVCAMIFMMIFIEGKKTKRTVNGL